MNEEQAHMLNRLGLDEATKARAVRIVERDGERGMAFVMEAARINNDLAEDGTAYLAGVNQWLDGLDPQGPKPIRNTVIVTIEYDADCADEILSIHEDTNRTYAGVKSVSARFATV